MIEVLFQGGEPVGLIAYLWQWAAMNGETPRPEDGVLPPAKMKR